MLHILVILIVFIGLHDVQFVCARAAGAATAGTPSVPVTPPTPGLVLFAKDVRYAQDAGRTLIAHGSLIGQNIIIGISSNAHLNGAMHIFVESLEEIIALPAIEDSAAIAAVDSFDKTFARGAMLFLAAAGESNNQHRLYLTLSGDPSCTTSGGRANIECPAVELWSIDGALLDNDKLSALPAASRIGQRALLMNERIYTPMRFSWFLGDTRYTIDDIDARALPASLRPLAHSDHLRVSWGTHKASRQHVLAFTATPGVVVVRGVEWEGVSAFAQTLDGAEFEGCLAGDCAFGASLALVFEPEQIGDGSYVLNEHTDNSSVYLFVGAPRYSNCPGAGGGDGYDFSPKFCEESGAIYVFKASIWEIYGGIANAFELWQVIHRPSLAFPLKTEVQPYARFGARLTTNGVSVAASDAIHSTRCSMTMSDLLGSLSPTELEALAIGEGHAIDCTDSVHLYELSFDKRQQLWVVDNIGTAGAVASVDSLAMRGDFLLVSGPARGSLGNEWSVEVNTADRNGTLILWYGMAKIDFVSAAGTRKYNSSVPGTLRTLKVAFDGDMATETPGGGVFFALSGTAVFGLSLAELLANDNRDYNGIEVLRREYRVDVDAWMFGIDIGGGSDTGDNSGGSGGSPSGEGYEIADDGSQSILTVAIAAGAAVVCLAAASALLCTFLRHRRRRRGRQQPSQQQPQQQQLQHQQPTRSPPSRHESRARLDGQARSSSARRNKAPTRTRTGSDAGNARTRSRAGSRAPAGAAHVAGGGGGGARGRDTALSSSTSTVSAYSSGAALLKERKDSRTFIHRAKPTSPGGGGGGGGVYDLALLPTSDSGQSSTTNEYSRLNRTASTSTASSEHAYARLGIRTGGGASAVQARNYGFAPSQSSSSSMASMANYDRTSVLAGNGHSYTTAPLPDTHAGRASAGNGHNYKAAPLPDSHAERAYANAPLPNE